MREFLLVFSLWTLLKPSFCIALSTPSCPFPDKGEFFVPCKLFQLFSCYISAILYSSVLAFIYLNISLLHQRQCLCLPRFQSLITLLNIINMRMEKSILRISTWYVFIPDYTLWFLEGLKFRMQKSGSGEVRPVATSLSNKGVGTRHVRTWSSFWGVRFLLLNA